MNIRYSGRLIVLRGKLDFRSDHSRQQIINLAVRDIRMRTVKREEDRTAGHQRSTSRYSINRIQPAGKSPDVAA